jgi:hypothetical protein
VRILGIDASTSVVGLVIIDYVNGFDPQTNLVHYEPIMFKGKMTFWEKCDHVRERLCLLKQLYDVDRFFIEEPLKRFSEGFSSAETIGLLQRFNGIVCFLVRDIFKVEPTYINVSSARKSMGVRVTSKAKAGGKNAKQQTFDFVTSTDLSFISWPKKMRSNNIVDWAKDVVDAYVVALGGAKHEHLTPTM